ncbi:uncharacterized protein LOC114365728 [Ostrinia furnacalis]|uniref:uncharacterized protein LOC114365728 n=1 Tax=Ostrinia furnacalis TaxID=93504 RepID=UPI0010389945|nr:uncharacterized protein LOC114365728 [Ostrinia furnacalis]
MSFSGKVVIVTGASSGIGAATAVAFGREGASVVLVGRNDTKLKKVAESVKKHLIVRADVSKGDDAKLIISKTLETFGKIDVLVNNAGIARVGGLLAGDLMNSYDEVMNTNLRAVFHLTCLATPHLVKTKGNVVNISSVAGCSTPPPMFVTYAASKAALDQFTRGAALELAPSGVRVNGVSPGPVVTDIIENSGMPTSYDEWATKTALGRSSDSVEIADLVLYLASDKAKCITGSSVVADNGYLLK